MADRAKPAVELEAEARAINAEPWEPPPGMVKRRCPHCRYFFAAPQVAPPKFCPDCASLGKGTGPRLPA
jgi:hypothetical protein